jgi:hypothetical protein
MQIVKKHGTMWARNTKNISRIPSSSNGGKGVYVLFDGSMPVYVGKGNIKQRVSGARRSKRRGQLWDRFSWYALKDPNMMHDIEVLLLSVFPHYLRALTKNDGHFLKSKPTEQPDGIADQIRRSNGHPSVKISRGRERS